MEETSSYWAQLGVPIRARSENSFVLHDKKSIESINELKAGQK